MALSLAESQTVNELAGVLYDFLPGSGNQHSSFPIAATSVGVGEFWTPGSKRPALLQLLERTLTLRRNRFCPLIEQIVRLSLGWRSGKGHPLTLAEIDQLNVLLRRLDYKIPALHDPAFRRTLAQPAPPPEPAPAREPIRRDALYRSFTELLQLEPRPRGLAYERFLRDLFEFSKLEPREPFTLRGEQIDGSFQLDGATYLLEAKWQNEPIGNRELMSFHGQVRSKSQWTRGLFISHSGYTAEGLDAFGRGNPVQVICMNGEELWQLLSQSLDLTTALIDKARRAAETGRSFVPLRELYPQVV